MGYQSGNECLLPASFVPPSLTDQATARKETARFHSPIHPENYYSVKE
jgi:hypothetical protein